MSKIKFKNCVKEHCGVFKAGVKICTKICPKKTFILSVSCKHLNEREAKKPFHLGRGRMFTGNYACQIVNHEERS